MGCATSKAVRPKTVKVQPAGTAPGGAAGKRGHPRDDLTVSTGAPAVAWSAGGREASFKGARKLAGALSSPGPRDTSAPLAPEGAGATAKPGSDGDVAMLGATRAKWNSWGGSDNSALHPLLRSGSGGLVTGPSPHGAYTSQMDRTESAGSVLERKTSSAAGLVHSRLLKIVHKSELASSKEDLMSPGRGMLLVLGMDVDDGSGAGLGSSDTVVAAEAGDDALKTPKSSSTRAGSGPPVLAVRSDSAKGRFGVRRSPEAIATREAVTTHAGAARAHVVEGPSPTPGSPMTPTAGFGSGGNSSVSAASDGAGTRAGADAGADGLAGAAEAASGPGSATPVSMASLKKRWVSWGGAHGGSGTRMIGFRRGGSDRHLGSSKIGIAGRFPAVTRARSNLGPADIGSAGRGPPRPDPGTYSRTGSSGIPFRHDASGPAEVRVAKVALARPSTEGSLGSPGSAGDGGGGGGAAVGGGTALAVIRGESNDGSSDEDVAGDTSAHHGTDNGGRRSSSRPPLGISVGVASSEERTMYTEPMSPIRAMLGSRSAPNSRPGSGTGGGSFTFRQKQLNAQGSSGRSLRDVVGDRDAESDSEAVVVRPRLQSMGSDRSVNSMSRRPKYTGGAPSLKDLLSTKLPRTHGGSGSLQGSGSVAGSDAPALSPSAGSLGSATGATPALPPSVLRAAGDDGAFSDVPRRARLVQAQSLRGRVLREPEDAHLTRVPSIDGDDP